MVRILIAALILLVAAYFYLNQGSSPGDVVPTQPEAALEKARQVEKTVQDQAEKLKQQVEEQTAESDDDTSDDDDN